MNEQQPAANRGPPATAAAPTAAPGVPPAAVAVPAAGGAAIADTPGAAGAEPRRKRGKSAGETLIRVTYHNHIALSQLADTKANMLISINGLIVSVLIALLTPRLDRISWEFIPAAVLIAGCVLSLAFAVIASRPRLNRRPITLEQVRRNEGNVLFFGQFMSLSLDEFQESMRLLLSDRKLLHDNLTRQLYYMGESLLAKYSHLHIAYVVFFVSMAIAAVVFVVLLVTFGVGATA